MMQPVDFGPGRYTFFLSMKLICEVERLCGNKSIDTMYAEMSAAIGLTKDDDTPVFVGGGGVRIKDIYEVIRCAAIGGGSGEVAGEVVKVSAIDAQRLVNDYVDGRPYTESTPVAWAILHHTLLGDPPAPSDDTAQKKS